jgi:diguanylate cyclase (GGDEF)-like protein/PAS domain S-box-containing protein
VKILVIDDDQSVRRFLQELFLLEGFEVATAVDGEEGLRKAREEKPFLVVTDVLMPRMDGFQLLRTFKTIESLCDVSVIFYTGSYLDAEDRKLALDLGVGRYLEKPIDANGIMRAVREVIEENRRKPAGVQVPGMEEPVFLRLYNERLVKKLESKAAESEQARLALEHIMESMGDGVVVISRDRRIIQTNSAAARLHGMNKSEIVGLACYEALHGRQSPCEDASVTCPVVAIFENQSQTVKLLHSHRNVNGEERQIEITATALRDANGKVLAVVETLRDIMDNDTDDELVKLVKRLNETQIHLKEMAVTDELTGLRNRRYIMERLDEEFLRARRSGRPLGLIMLDIDHFKEINDSFGHVYGDLALRVIAARIRSMVRKHDLVGRVGGEEFLVVCPDSSLEDTLIVAERVRNTVHEDVISDGVNEVSVALSAGVTMLTDDDANSSRVFSRADTALYRAKDEGRNRVVVL